MDAIQDLQLLALAVTITTHALPVIPCARLAVVCPLSTQEYVDSMMTNLVDTISTITKEVSLTLQNAPYIRGLSGIILQIIKIREVRSPLNAIVSST